MRTPCRAASALALATLIVSCTPRPASVVMFSLPTWYEDGGTYYDVSPDGHWALLAGRSGIRLAKLPPGPADTAAYPALDAVRAVVGAEETAAWSAVAPRPPGVPPAAQLRRSPDGSRVAYFVPGQDTLFAGPADRPVAIQLDGVVTGFGWVPKGDLLYVLVLRPDGLSALDRINLDTQAVQPIREQLDAPPRPDNVAVAPDGRTLYLALASDTVPEPEARHRPDARRDTDIYALDLRSGRLRAAVREPGDDIYPIVVGDTLYWTHNRYADSIVVLPVSGGEGRAVLPVGMLPYWSADGRQLAYTGADYRLADWGLNLDAFVVSVNDSGRSTSPPAPIAAGYHEDFTPTWSPSGAWIAYHSHRPSAPVPLYDSPGHTDDIYLRRPHAPMNQEIRLTDWGWETGMADWAPDGRRLVFDSWDQGGTPGIAKPWIVTLDTATGRLVDRHRLPLPRGVVGTRLASWSPKGTEIAFVAQEESGHQTLWVTTPGGRGARRLAAFENWTYGGLDWTPDGEAIVFGALAGGRVQIFRIPSAGGTAAQLTNDSASVMHPQVSPDGRWIAATRLTHAKVLRQVPL
jgi:Tol biopolymer transport system component